MNFAVLPLVTMKMTQPFGVDWSEGGLPLPGGSRGTYAQLGLSGHNGWDLRAPSGTPALAVHDGVVEAFTGDSKNGYGIHLRLYVDLPNEEGVAWPRRRRAEVVYGHLQKVLKTGPVKAGEAIAECDNTGISTGSHLHFGVRIQEMGDNGAWQVVDYDNGLAGYVDPTEFYPYDIWYKVARDFKLPVDDCYGFTPRTPGVLDEISWAAKNVWFLFTFGRLMTDRETKAFRFGFWDLRFVLDPANFDVWSRFSKMEAQKLGII